MRKLIILLTVGLALLLAACGSTEPEAKSYPEGTLAAILAADGRFNTFLTLTDEIVGPHGSTPLLTRTDENQRTVFAPTDHAFAALPEDLMEKLENDPGAAEEMFFHHLLDRPLLAKDFGLLPTWPTFLTIVKVPITDDGGTIRYDGAEVTETDIAAGNGIIHVLNSVAGTELLSD